MGAIYKAEFCGKGPRGSRVICLLMDRGGSGRLVRASALTADKVFLTRVAMGLNPDEFRTKLVPGETLRVAGVSGPQSITRPGRPPKARVGIWTGAIYPEGSQWEAGKAGVRGWVGKFGPLFQLVDGRGFGIYVETRGQDQAWSVTLEWSEG